MKALLSDTVITTACKLGICAVAATTCPPVAVAALGLALTPKDIFDAVATVGGKLAADFFGETERKAANPQDYFEQVKYHFGGEARFDLTADVAVSNAVAAFFEQALLDLSFDSSDFARFRETFGRDDGIFRGIAVRILAQVSTPSAKLISDAETALATDILETAVRATIKARGAELDLLIDMADTHIGMSRRIAANVSEGNAATQSALAQGFAEVLSQLEGLKGGKAALGLTEDQVRKLLAMYRQEGLPANQWFDALLKNVQGDKALIERLKQDNNGPHEITALRQAAAAAIENKNYELAEALFRKAEAMDAETEQETRRRQAQTIAERAEMFTNMSRHKDAADAWLDAHANVAGFDSEQAFDYTFKAAKVLTDHGRIFGDYSLAKAAAILRYMALPLVQRCMSPKKWAQAQNLLGVVLQSLGARLDGAAGVEALSHARLALEAALEVRTRKNCSVEWAMTQNNLGVLLQTLGARLDRKAAASALSDARRAYEAAREVCNREDFPVLWAMTQNNLGIVHQTLGIRLEGAAGIAALGDARIAFEAALEVYVREDYPMDWAMTQNNLGIVQTALGSRLDNAAGIETLEAARKAYEGALEVTQVENFPVDWATTQNNLGNVLTELGERLDGSAGIDVLGDARKAYEAALEVWTRDDFPVQWAMAKENLAIAGQILFLQTGFLQHLDDGIAALEGALEVFCATRMSYYRKKAEHLLAVLKARRH